MTTESHRRHPDDHQSQSAANIQYIRSVSQLLDSEGKLIRRGSSLPKFAGNTRALDDNYNPQDAFTQSEEILARLRDPEGDWENFDFLPDDIFTRTLPELIQAPHVDQPHNAEIQELNQPVRFQLIDFNGQNIKCPECGMVDRWTTTERYDMDNSPQDENQVGKKVLTNEATPNGQPKVITKFIHVHMDDPLIVQSPNFGCDLEASYVQYAVVAHAPHGALDINGEKIQLAQRYRVSVPQGEDQHTRNRVLRIVRLLS